MAFVQPRAQCLQPRPRCLLLVVAIAAAAVAVLPAHGVAAAAASRGRVHDDDQGGAVHLFITSNVNGQMFPVQEQNRQRLCRVHEYTTTPCDCVGGAHRRLAVLAEARRKHPHGAILVEAGRFAPSVGATALAGNVSIAHSARWLARSGYDVFALSSSEFLLDAHHGGTHSAATLTMREYVQIARRTSAPEHALPPAVATNFAGRGADVARHTLVQLPNNRTIAFLAAFDPAHLAPVLSPSRAARFDGVKRALALQVRALQQLARPPDAIVCIVGATYTRAAAAGAPHSERKVLEDLVEQVFDVDVFVVTSSRSFLKDSAADDSGVYTYRNWLNRTVLVVKLPPGEAAQASRVEHAQFTWAGAVAGGRGWPRLLPGVATHVALNCSVDTHSVGGTRDHEALVLQHRAAEAHFFAEAIGHLGGGGFDGQRLRPGACTTLSPSALALAIPQDRCGGQAAAVVVDAAQAPAHAALPSWSSCGCYVAQCAAGSLIADAYASHTNADVSFVNAGAIGASLPENVTLQAVQALIKYNDVLVHVNVPGSALRSALAHSVGVLGGDLQDSIASSGGRFLQLSRSLKLEWHFNSAGVPTAGRIRVQRRGAMQFEDLDDDANYTLATNTFVAGGGDGFSNLVAAAGPVDISDAGFGRSAVQNQLEAHSSPSRRLHAPTPGTRITQNMPTEPEPEPEPEEETPYRRRATDIIAIVCTYVFGMALFVTIVLKYRRCVVAGMPLSSPSPFPSSLPPPLSLFLSFSLSLFLSFSLSLARALSLMEMVGWVSRFRLCVLGPSLCVHPPTEGRARRGRGWAWAWPSARHRDTRLL